MRNRDRGSETPKLTCTIEIKNKQGQVVARKEVVTVKGMLHLAHQERLRRTSTELAQAPTKENGETAIVIVRVTTQRGTFSGMGDASPRNVQAHLIPAFIRMAETRGLARALRAALDIEFVALEELEGDFEYVEGPSPDSTRDRPPAEHSPAPRGRDERAAHPQRPAPSNGGVPQHGAGDRMSDKQRKLLYRLAAERGFEGEKAHAWLHEQFRVDSLDKVSVRAASAFIDRLKAPNGQNGHAPS